MKIKSYREVKRLKSFEERYYYLRLEGIVGQSTFGYDRYLNQLLYVSKEWRKTRDEIIIRDDGNDLSMEGYRIYSGIIVHHINPITVEDIELGRDVVYDHDNLICTTLRTHNAIHYGDEKQLSQLPIERKPNDTCPWR